MVQNIPLQFSFSCPGCAPSWLLVHLPVGRAWEMEKSLVQRKHYSAAAKTSKCYWHYSHTKSKTWHFISLLKEKLNLFQLKSGQRVTGKGVQSIGLCTQEYEELNSMWLTEGKKIIRAPKPQCYGSLLTVGVLIQVFSVNQTQLPGHRIMM